MKLQRTKSGFTLIELLVVITIIGILATWAVAVYASQIQKARDATRINDIKALQSGIDQNYQDLWEYPHANLFFTSVRPYVEKFPSDPKHAQPCNNAWSTANSPECAYAYLVANDNNGIAYWEYEISTAFENPWNVTEKAAKDWGGAAWELNRLEIWVDVALNVTTVAANWITSTKKWACTLAWTKAGTATALVVINWNPTTAANQCD